jgi:hypothetical protein
MSAAMPKFDAATAIGDECEIQAASPRFVDPPSLLYESDAMCHLCFNPHTGITGSCKRKQHRWGSRCGLHQS